MDMEKQPQVSDHRRIDAVWIRVRALLPLYPNSLAGGLRLSLLLFALLLSGAYALLMSSPGLADTRLRQFIEWPRTDFSRSLIDLKEIHSGGPPKDGIPAIDTPRFVSVSEADAWLAPDEPVILVSHGQQIHAYPLQIMIYHEIVNDRLDGIPISVTFCPLCNASIVFDRRVTGKILDFGTTGRLRKSDMLMYDRQTESWWQQFTGQALVGELAGTELAQLPSRITAYAELRRLAPGARILSRDTGYQRPYGQNPYRGYDRIGNIPFLFDDPADPRLPAMARVLSLNNRGVRRIYPLAAIAAHGLIEDRLAADAIVVVTTATMRSALDRQQIRESRLIPTVAAWFRRVDGQELSFELRKDHLHDRQTGSSWDALGRAVSGPLQGQHLRPVPGGVFFAFALLAFRPHTEIYRNPPD